MTQHSLSQSDQEPLKQTHGSQLHSAKVFDEIESDTESFQEKQRMHNAKCLKQIPKPLECLPAPRMTANLRKDCIDGRFLVPDIPTSRRSTRTSTVNTVLRHDTELPGSQSPWEDKRDDSSCNYRNDSRKISPISRKPDSSISIERLHEDRPEDSSLPYEDKHASPATIASPQVSGTNAKNWSNLDVNHPIKKALSQGRQPDPDLLLKASEYHDTSYKGNESQTLEVQQESSGAQEQPNKKAQEYELGGQALGTSANEEQGRKEIEDSVVPIANRKTTDHIAGINDSAAMTYKNEKSSADQLAELNLDVRPSENGGSPSSELIKRENKSKAPYSARSVTQDRSLRAKQSKEIALSRQAEKMMLEADGAKQMEVEKREKKVKKTPLPTSTPKATPTRTPKVPKHPPRTPAQKAQRVARDAQKRAERAKTMEAAKPTGPCNWAQALFQTSSVDGRQGSDQIETDSGEESIRQKPIRDRSSSRDVTLLKHLATEPNHPCSPPLGLTNSGQNRRSFTPLVPSPNINKPHPNKGSLASSSPLLPRSSTRNESPLRSVLKRNQSSSASRRSVSFVNDHEKEASFPAPKSLVEINNQLALTNSKAATSSSSKASTPAKLARSTKSTYSSQSNGNSATKPQPANPSKDSTTNGADNSIVKKELVQQKLNVKRDRKMKGRADGPPRIESMQNIIHSSNDSGDESASSFDEDISDGIVKAGPSSKKKLHGADRLGRDSEIKVRLLSRVHFAEPNRFSSWNSIPTLSTYSFFFFLLTSPLTIILTDSFLPYRPTRAEHE